MTGGLLSHSCIPNTRLIFEVSYGDDKKKTAEPSLPKYQMVVYSATKIAKGEKLTYCSLRNLARTGTRERKKKVAARLIDCNCER